MLIKKNIDKEKLYTRKEFIQMLDYGYIYYAYGRAKKGRIKETEKREGLRKRVYYKGSDILEFIKKRLNHGLL